MDQEEFESHSVIMESIISSWCDDNDTYEIDDNASLASSVSATGSNLSFVTGRQKYHKRVR